MKGMPAIHRKWAGLGITLVVLVSAAWGTPSSHTITAAVPDAVSDSDIVILQAGNTTVSPEDSVYTLSIYLTNPGREVAGMTLTLGASRPDLVQLPASPDPLFDLTGSDIAYWEYVIANDLSPTTFRFLAMSNVPEGTDPPPLPPSTESWLICRMIVERVVPLSILDTLQDRSVTWYVAGVGTYFSDPDGQLIGHRDSIRCLNPPTCDSVDTIQYDANIYVHGTLTFGPSCKGPGDADGNGVVNSADIIWTINYIFRGGPWPACFGASADVNCNIDVDASDVIYLVNYTFKSGPPPVEPCNP